MKYSVSIIILTYNQQSFIEETLKGIFMQKIDFPVELIICDDCSTDRTDEVIQKIILDAPQNITVKYFRHPKNLGSTPNFYFALKQVTGKYLAFCEGDDYWTDPEKLHLQLQFLQENPAYSMCFHTAENISDDSDINSTLFSKVEDREYTPLEIYRHWIVHTATVMMKAEVLQSPAKNETMLDDTLQYFDTILFLAAGSIGKIWGMQRKMSCYRRHDAGLSAGKINFKRDLKHNKLDAIIGKYYGGEIKKTADWQIFSRSIADLEISLSAGKFQTTLTFLPWLFRNRIIFYYLLKKISKN
ncbi:glycosyltransferase [Chryseobacterium sp. GP-SGM7]|uniref:glycosyltransferase n=1 Tax=Chryseobacterium sp. GP-SGM7 TaxID=3411323 RepID=UPI003B945A78